MRLFPLITLPYMRKHKIRSILTAVGVVIGVATLISMREANRTVLAGFTRTLEQIAGKAELQVTAGEAGFPEDVLAKTQALPEVGAAAPVIEAGVDAGAGGEGRLLIMAVDMTGDQSFRSYDMEGSSEDVVDDPLSFLAQPDSLIVTGDYAARNGLKQGSQLKVQSMDGLKVLTIRGTLRPGGLAQAYGGNLGIMDIYAAQKVFGRGRRFDRIDIAPAPGVSVEKAQAALQQTLGPGFAVESPASRGKQFESLLGVYSLTIGISSAFAVFIGLFIIYNSFSLAITERRGEIGLLRALGATRSQIRNLFLMESFVVGIAGSALGIGLGVWMGGALSQATSTMMGDLAGVYARPDGVVIERGYLIFAAALGVCCSMIAAWVPARSAASVDPLTALRRGEMQTLSAGESRWRSRGALAALVVALVLIPWSHRSGPFYFGFLMMVIAVLLYSPSLAVVLARWLRGVLRRIYPVEGVLAADSLIQAPRRTAATVTALTLALALVVGQAGVARSMFAAIDDWLAETLNPDLFVSTSETLMSRDFRFPGSMRADLEKVEGVGEVQPVRTTRVLFRGSVAQLVAVDIERVGARVRRRAVAGDLRVADQQVREEKGVLISDNLAQVHHLGLGDVVELSAPGGMLRLPVVAIVRDFTTPQTGSIFLERSAYVRLWGDDSVDLFRIYLRPGAQVVKVRDLINKQLSTRVRAVVLLNADVKRYARGIVNQWFRMTYVQVVVAVLVAVLGIVNTLTVSISDRRRELGILRAVGALRGQVRATLWMEAMTIGLIGVAEGCLLGGVQLYYILQIVRRSSMGITLDYAFPISITLVLIPVILGAAVLSAVVPAERAVHAPLVEALEYE